MEEEDELQSNCSERRRLFHLLQIESLRAAAGSVFFNLIEHFFFEIFLI